MRWRDGRLARPARRGRPALHQPSHITEVTPWVPGWAQLQCKIAAGTPFGDVMKRMATFVLLLVALSAAWSIPAHAQRISPQENARQSKKAIKKQQKTLNKANKKQRKAMKKAAKKQRKQMRTANRRQEVHFSSVRENWVVPPGLRSF